VLDVYIAKPVAHCDALTVVVATVVTRTNFIKGNMVEKVMKIFL
jgi:hypothetical protein